jgi:cytochrome P450
MRDGCILINHEICTEFGAIYSAWVECEWLNLEKDVAPVLAENAKLWVRPDSYSSVYYGKLTFESRLLHGG